MGTPIDTSVWDRDLEAQIDDLPGHLSWNGFTGIRVSLTELTQAQTLVLAGNIDVVHYEAIFRAAAITGRPAATNRVMIIPFGSSQAINYEVVDSRLTQDGVAIHLVLKADHRA